MTVKPSKGTGTRNAQQREPRGKQPGAAQRRSVGPRPVTPQNRRSAASQNRSAGPRPVAPQNRRSAASQNRSARPRPVAAGPRVKVAGASKVRAVYPERVGTKKRIGEPWNTLFFAVPCASGAQAKKTRRRADRYIFGFTVLLVLYGLAMIYAASSFRLDDPLGAVKKQAMYAGLGLALMVFLPFIDYHRLLSLGWCTSYSAGLVLVVATMAVGRRANGAARWIQIGSVSFQPSEFMKTALILFFAVYLVNEYRRFARKPEQIIWVMAVFGGVPAYLVSRQNLSTGLLIASLVFFITFLGVKSTRIHIGIILLAAFAFWIVVNYYKQMPFLKAYQIGRIDNWLHPVTKLRGQPDQVTGGKFGLSIGSWLGTGIGRGYIKRDLPEAANDIILAVIGEELGLVGICILLLFYLSLLFCIIQTALKAPDRYGALLCGGVAIHIFLHTAMNIMVVTGSMPNTGVTLPFVSSGGTSLLCFMAEIALVLSVSREVRPEKSL